MDAGDAQAVLGGQGRDDAHAVAVQGHDGLEVGLDAGTAAGIGTGNGQDVGGAHGYLLFCDGGLTAVGHKRPDSRVIRCLRARRNAGRSGRARRTVGTKKGQGRSLPLCVAMER